MSHHASLSRPPSDLIGGTWIALDGAPGPGARVVASRNPANPSHVPWSGVSRLEHVDRAVQAARRALPEWSKPSNRARRFAVLRRFAELSKSRAGALAEIICDEVGKALWESAGEASALASKVEITLDESADGVGLRRVTDFELVGSPTRALRGSFRPHGVMCVLAPFNFPASGRCSLNSSPMRSMPKAGAHRGPVVGSSTSCRAVPTWPRP
jgi:acyl-CoA reductase-like NAD-dependent aldehyde dehydrogenase